jgi:hypothetical protein
MMMLLKTCLLLCCGFVLINCSESAAPQLKTTVEINPPVNEMAVYATAVYTEEEGALVLNFLKMNSIIFLEQRQSGDSSYMSAEITEFIPSDFPGQGSKMGTLDLSITDKWIAVENESITSSTFLYKSSIDTTSLPTANFQHLTIYPRVLVEGEISEIYRPAANFISADYKKFRVGREINWDDPFGYGSGLYLETQSSIPGAEDTLTTTAIYDAHGLIISQYSLDIIVTFGDISDTTRIHNISRRVSDYTYPFLTRELKYYADQVIQKDLTPIYR